MTDEIRKLLELQDVEVRAGNKKVRISRREAIAQVLIRKCLNGDPHSLRLLLGYVDGLPRQNIEVTGAEGGPVEVVFPAGFRGV